MKTYKKILVPLVLFSLLAASCSAPETPPNNVNDRGHEMPYVTTYVFTPGTLSDTTADGKNYLGDKFTPLPNAQNQEVRFAYNKAHKLERTGQWNAKANVWYRLSIQFVNKAGADINYQYVNDEHARALHQFFFRTFLWKEGTEIQNMLNVRYGEDNPVKYLYGDKFEDGKLIDPPIGFLGYIKVDAAKAKAKGMKHFALNGILVHAMGYSKLNPRSGNPFPFDHPGSEITGVTDIDHRFEVNIIY